jgi:hypothetical protein
MDRNQQQAILNDLAAGRFKETESGIYLPDHNLVASGEYFDRVNGGEWQTTRNLVVNEGLGTFAECGFRLKAKPAGYYLAYLVVRLHQQQTGLLQTLPQLPLKL